MWISYSTNESLILCKHVIDKQTIKKTQTSIERVVGNCYGKKTIVS